MLDFRHLDKKDIFVLICGLTIVIRIRIVGTFLLPEILLAFYYLTTRFSSYKKDKNIKKLIGYCFLWLIGTIIANVVNDINLEDSLKGVVFLLILLILIPPIHHLLIDKPERILLFYLGSGISGLFMPYFAVSEMQAIMWSGEVFQFYAYVGLVASFCYYLYYKGNKKLSIALLEIASIVGLFNGSRNLFLTTTVAAIILLYSLKSGNKVQSYSKRIPALLVTLLLGVFVVDYVYEELAGSGVLGEYAYQKYLTQKEGGNIVQGGRTATFMGLMLVAEKPITGWGSYAKDTWGFSENYYYEHNMKYYEDPYSTPILPSHSYFVGAWMQNGILGAVFWIWILVMLWKIFKSGCLLQEPRIMGLLIFQFTALLWNWAFSPFGDRVTFLFLMITYLIIYRNYRLGLYHSTINE